MKGRVKRAAWPCQCVALCDGAGVESARPKSGVRHLPGGAPQGDAPFDLLVIGGGINGVGIARDAAGRGLRVALAEKDDLASHTSSASTKLIHGGLRYLEYFEFRLVRESLQERERLTRIAPHLSWPLRFVMPRPRGGRPGWMIRLGLWLYDHIGGRISLPRSASVDLGDPAWGAGLRPELRAGAGADGFAYSDAWVDDARLVVFNAIDAAARGATILTRTTVMAARVEGDLWRVALSTGQEIAARAIVNAAGPWVSSVLGTLGDARADGGITLVKGSHLVVPRLTPGDHAFLLQQTDGRIVFAIPYMDSFTLVGTTDVVVAEGERESPAISAEETAYLLAAANAAFARQTAPGDVVWSYSGVRPLFDDGASDAKAITRDYVLKLGQDNAPQVLSVYGGKLTTYRRLAEHALADLAPWLPPHGPEWTATVPLPGGDLPPGGFAAFLAGVQARWPFLDEGTARRMAHAYGTRIAMVLGDAGSLADLGEPFGGGLSEAELRYLWAHEWARTADDVLWRRTKLGLICPAQTPARVAQWLVRHNQGGTG
jgi:glycerol-3-phosphate dehydrogenase